MSSEATWVAWSEWDTSEGARWSITLREGVTEVEPIAKSVEEATALLMAAGWTPTVRGS